MSHYKNYLLRQLGLKEDRNRHDIDDPYPEIDPQELEKGTEDEKDEHGMPIKKAELTAKQHLGKPDQGHYYSGMEKAKDKGMLKDMVSPNAKPTPIIGVAIRGSSTGGLPSGMDQHGISPKTPTGRLGGYEPIPIAKDNSKLFNKTPQNSDINSTTPIAEDPPETPAEEHPHQVQNVAEEPPQAVTGASTDSDPTLTVKSTTSKEVNVDAETPPDANAENEPNDMDGEESLDDDEKANKQDQLNEGTHKSGCECGFCKNKGKMGKKKEDEGGPSAADNVKKSFKDKEQPVYEGKSKCTGKSDCTCKNCDDSYYDEKYERDVKKGKTGNISVSDLDKTDTIKFNKGKLKKEVKEQVSVEKLNEVKKSLQEKAIAGKMDKKETAVFRLIQEVLEKRRSKK
jgi:hypothetical protein